MGFDTNEYSKNWQKERRELLYRLYEIFLEHKSEIKIRTQEELDVIKRVATLHANRRKK